MMTVLSHPPIKHDNAQ